MYWPDPPTPLPLLTQALTSASVLSLRGQRLRTHPYPQELPPFVQKDRGLWTEPLGPANWAPSSHGGTKEGVVVGQPGCQAKF